MKVLIVEPGKYPREADIEHTLKAEQAIVGGTIQAAYPWRDRACIVCNDDGIAMNLPLNRMLGDYDIIHGTFFICGLTAIFVNRSKQVDYPARNTCAPLS